MLIFYDFLVPNWVHFSLSSAMAWLYVRHLILVAWSPLPVWLTCCAQRSYKWGQWVDFLYLRHTKHTKIHFQRDWKTTYFLISMTQTFWSCSFSCSANDSFPSNPFTVSSSFFLDSAATRSCWDNSLWLLPADLSSTALGCFWDTY